MGQREMLLASVQIRARGRGAAAPGFPEGVAGDSDVRCQRRNGVRWLGPQRPVAGLSLRPARVAERRERAVARARGWRRGRQCTLGGIAQQARDIVLKWLWREPVQATLDLLGLGRSWSRAQLRPNWRT